MKDAETRAGGKNLDLQIVGVVQDLQNMSLREAVRSFRFLSYPTLPVQSGSD